MALINSLSLGNFCANAPIISGDSVGIQARRKGKFFWNEGADELENGI